MSGKWDKWWSENNGVIYGAQPTESIRFGRKTNWYVFEGINHFIEIDDT